MKKAKILLLALALAAPAVYLIAQDSGNNQPPGDFPPPREGGPGGPGFGPGGPGGPGMRRPPMHPLMKALDVNGDGIIDEQEIANAPAALKTLDKNGDGKLTPDELRPPMPPMGRRGPGGGPGFGRPPGGDQGGDQGQRPQRPPADQP